MAAIRKSKARNANEWEKYYNKRQEVLTLIQKTQAKIAKENLTLEKLNKLLKVLES